MKWSPKVLLFLAVVAAVIFFAGMYAGCNFQKPEVPAMLPGAARLSIVHDTLKTGISFYDSTWHERARIDTLLSHDTLFFYDTIYERISGADNLTAAAAPGMTDHPAKPIAKSSALDFGKYNFLDLGLKAIAHFESPNPRQLFEVHAYGGFEDIDAATSGFGLGAAACGVRGLINLDVIRFGNFSIEQEISYQRGFRAHTAIEGKLTGWGG